MTIIKWSIVAFLAILILGAFMNMIEDDITKEKEQSLFTTIIILLIPLIYIIAN